VLYFVRAIFMQQEEAPTPVLRKRGIVENMTLGVVECPNFSRTLGRCLCGEGGGVVLRATYFFSVHQAPPCPWPPQEEREKCAASVQSRGKFYQYAGRRGVGVEGEQPTPPKSGVSL